MRTTSTLIFLALATALAGCPSNAVTRNDAGGGGTDTGVPPSDMGPQPDTGMPGTDSGTPATSVSLTNLVNPSATDHPADGTVVNVTGSMVALTPRLFISQSTTSMNCLFAMWVGTPGGGDYSGIEVTDSFAPDASGDCFMSPAHVIPDTVMIGDTITALNGRFQNYCPSGSTCPPNTSQELSVSFGTLTVGAPGSAPTATTVSISDIAGMGTSGARSIALQGALVRLTGTVVQDPPTATNHNVMLVSAMGGATPTMPINVSKYSGVGCQRTQLTTATAGTTVGDITGVLQYSFGQWVIQPRQAADLPGVVCAVDAGVPPG